MPVEMLTYAALANRLNISTEAARSLAQRLRLPRSLSNDGKALVSVDLDTIRHTPRAPHSRKTKVEKTKIETLRAEIARLEELAAAHRAESERECERANRLMADLLNATAETMSARETITRLQRELVILRASGQRQVPGRLGRLAASVVHADRKASGSEDVE
jgi:hypothetical protein